MFFELSGLTSLGDDGSGGDDNDGPWELLFEVLDSLLVHLVEGSNRPEWNAHKQTFARTAVLLLVLN